MQSLILDSILVITVLLCRSEIVYEDADEVNYLSYLKPRKVGRWSLEGMLSSVKLSRNQPIDRRSLWRSHREKHV